MITLLKGNSMNNDKKMIWVAKLVSIAFTPFYLPLVGLIIMFLFSYMNLLPWEYRLMVLTLVYFFTILLPTFLIHFYRRRDPVCGGGGYLVLYRSGWGQLLFSESLHGSVLDWR